MLTCTKIKIDPFHLELHLTIIFINESFVVYFFNKLISCLVRKWWKNKNV